MSRIAVFPGSFDPITVGHEHLVRKGCELFAKVIVAVGINASKNYMFSLEQREQWIKDTFKDLQNVEVADYEGLTVDFCQKVGAQFILRGLRSSADFEYESSIAQMNHALHKDIETIFLVAPPALSAINSTIVRDIIRNGGDASQFVPGSVKLH